MSTAGLKRRFFAFFAFSLISYRLFVFHDLDPLVFFGGGKNTVAAKSRNLESENRVCVFLPLQKKNKGKKIDPFYLDTLSLIQKKVSDGISINEISLASKQIDYIKTFNFLTFKPYLFVCNVDEASIKTGNKLSEIVFDTAKKKKVNSLLVSASIESEISIMENEEEKIEFLNSIGLQETSLTKLAREGYSLLDLITFFTTGPEESRAWSCKAGSFAPEAGAKIHTDFQRGFIKAETISYSDFIKFNGEPGCRENGRIRQEGKDYIVKDGDIMNFKFNV